MQNRNLVSCFPAYNFLLHIPKFITSGTSISISIHFTIIHTFLPLYTPISNVSDSLLPKLLHLIQNSEKCGINISTTIIGSYMNNFLFHLILIQQFYIHHIFHFLTRFVIVELFVIISID